jgi:hypothetical protein
LAIVKNGICHLLNMEAKEIGKATARNLLKFVERKLPMVVGNKEIQVRVFFECVHVRDIFFFVR